jgi:hypothetical protein
MKQVEQREILILLEVKHTIFSMVKKSALRIAMDLLSTITDSRTSPTLTQSATIKQVFLLSSVA